MLHPLGYMRTAPLTLPLLEVTDLITPPDLNQARVNKCLIALVNRKVVQKDNSTVRVFIYLSGDRVQRFYRELFYITGREYLDINVNQSVALFCFHMYCVFCCMDTH